MKNLFLILTFLLFLNLNVQGQNYDYMIVCPDNYEMIKWADTLARFRNEQGIHTKVINIKEIGDNNPYVLKDYFEDIYNNWELAPAAILLLGDYSNDSTKGITSYRLSNIYDNEIKYLADNKLVDFDYDNLPEICIARMPADDAQQAELMVKKTIHYERFPSTNPDYYDRPITAMGFDESRWFQLCSEIIAGYFEKNGKNPNRLNSINNGTPDSLWSTNENTYKVINYFGPNGLNYIPSDLRHLTEWEATNNDIISAINKGCFLVQHRSHGTYHTWDNPDFTNNDINNLNNEDLTFIMSANCQTGDFGYGEGDNDCFAERFLRVENGAVAVVAASQVSYSFVNDTYVWGFYDYLWNDFMPYGNNTTSFKYPAFANAYGKYFLKQSLWPNNSIYKDVTYNLFHYFGDAYLQLNTELPQHITIEYPKEISTSCSSFIVKKDKDTRVALSVDGELIATSFGEDSIVNIKPFYKEGRIKIVATKQDHYRHEDFIEIRSKLNDEDLNIFPNPTNNILYVEGKGIKIIEVYNTLGQMLMKINNDGINERVEINCNMLKKGLFHLHIIYEDRRVGRTFIVV